MTIFELKKLVSTLKGIKDYKQNFDFSIICEIQAGSRLLNTGSRSGAKLSGSATLPLGISYKMSGV